MEMKVKELEFKHAMAETELKAQIYNQRTQNLNKKTGKRQKE